MNRLLHLSSTLGYRNIYESLNGSNFLSKPLNNDFCPTIEDDEGRYCKTAVTNDDGGYKDLNFELPLNSLLSQDSDMHHTLKTKKCKIDEIRVVQRENNNIVRDFITNYASIKKPVIIKGLLEAVKGCLYYHFVVLLVLSITVN